MAPDFPKPTKREKAPYRVTDPPRDSAGPKVVSRPEPPREERSTTPNREGPAKLTPEEIAALLKVHTANTPNKWDSAGTRFKVLFLPTGVVSILLSFALGPLGFFVPLIIAGLWASAPLLRQKREGW